MCGKKMVRVSGVLSCPDCGYNESFAQSGFKYDTPSAPASASKPASSPRQAGRTKTTGGKTARKTIFAVFGIVFIINLISYAVIGIIGLTSRGHALRRTDENVLYEKLPDNAAQKVLPESPAVKEAVSEILGKDISSLSGSDLGIITKLRIYTVDYNYIAVDYTLSDGSSGTVYPVSQDFDASDIVCFKELEKLDISDVSDYGLDLTGLTKLTSLYTDDVPNGIGNMIDLSQITELGIYGLFGSTDKLASFENVETLYLDCDFIEDIDIIKKFPKLKSVFLGSLNYVSDISALYSLKGLECLYLDSPDIDSVEFIAKNLPDIKELTITKSTAADFSPLAACTKLEKLNLDYNENAGDFSFVSGLDALTELSIYGAYNTENIPDLSALTKLKKLEIGGYKDLSLLTVSDGIEELTLYSPSRYCFGENGENIFLKFPKLRRLNIESGSLSDEVIAQIAAQPDIEVLNLKYTYLSGSIEPLLEAENIKEIYAENVSFPIDMTNLSDYGHIECLNLNSTDIYDLSKGAYSNDDSKVTDDIEIFLECFTGLKRLYAESNNIDSLSFVSAMPKLELLDIQGNSVTDLDELKDAECLKLVICTKNPVEDMAGLEDIVVYEESYY